jgi:hypothetical protein
MFLGWPARHVFWAAPMYPWRLLLESPTGAFPVPEAMDADCLPSAVQESITRLLDGPPKPAVSLAVMEEAQRSMIAPERPY